MEQMFDPQRQQITRDTAIPRFFMDAVLNERKSKTAGEVIYENVEMVEIIVPGDKNTVVVEPVTAMSQRRWPTQYQAFKSGQEQIPDGFPLELWPQIMPSEVKMLKAINCHTVEQLSAMPDQKLPKSPSIIRTRDQAKEFLNTRADAKSVIKMQNQLEELTKELEHKDRALDLLRADIADLRASIKPEGVKRKPGRPKKEEADSG